jgi:hypothetical protein
MNPHVLDMQRVTGAKENSSASERHAAGSKIPAYEIPEKWWSQPEFRLVRRPLRR